MLTTHLRFQLVCALSLVSIGCGDDPAVDRGNTQPGEACVSTNDCAIGFQCQDRLCEQTDPVRITLSWTVDTDFDLHVRMPNGSELYFGQANDQAYLGSDTCSMTAADTKCDKEDVHYEHAFLRTFAIPGSDLDAGDTDAGADVPDATLYEYWTDNGGKYWADNYGCDTAGDFTLSVVAQDGTVLATYPGTLPAACAQSEHFPPDNIND